MASNQHDDNCINCLHRHEKSTFKACIDCNSTSTSDNKFPSWTPVQEAQA